MPESTALKINPRRVNGNTNTQRWRLDALAIFTLTSDLNSHFPTLRPSHLPLPPPLRRHLSFLSFTAESQSFDPTSQLWPLRSAVTSAPLTGDKRSQPGPQCKHIKHAASINTRCQHFQRMDIMNVVRISFRGALRNRHKGELRFLLNGKYRKPQNRATQYHNRLSVGPQMIMFWKAPHRQQNQILLSVQYGTSWTH